MKATEHNAKTPSAETGFFATLRALLRAKGSSAPAARHPIGRLATLACAVAASLAFVATPASAATFHPYQSQLTGTPTGAGGSTVPFTAPNGLAVDGSDDLWISDVGPGLIDKFDSSGAFLTQGNGEGHWTGKGTDSIAFSNASSHLYLADTGYRAGSTSEADFLWVLNPDASFNSDLTGPWHPTPPERTRINIAADNSGGATDGDLYVAGSEPEAITRIDGTGGAAPFSATAPYIDGNQLTGSAFAGGFFAAANGIAVDPSGDLYVADTHNTFGSSLVNEFEPSGQFVRSITEAEGTSFSFITALAVDPVDGNLLVADSGRGIIYEFSPSGALVGETSGTETPAGSFGSIDGLAVDSTGRLYVSDRSNRVVDVFASVTVPDVSTGAASNLTGTTATLNGTVDPDGAGGLTSCKFEYVTEAAFLATGFADLSSGGSKECSPAFGSIPATGETPVSAQISGLTPGIAYRYRLVAANSNGTHLGHTKAIPLIVAAESVSEVTTTAATLNAQINPFGLATTYHFEYLPEEQFLADGESFTGASVEPVPDGALAPGLKAVAVSLTIHGLQPGTPYRYRVVATNSVAPGGIVGSARVLTTHSAGFDAGLADDRAYELVSPSVKDTGGGVYEFGNLHSGITQATENGAAITYVGEGFFQAPSLGSSALDEYTSLRGPDGWSTRNTTGESREEAFAPLPPPALPPPPVLPPAATAAAKVLEETPTGSVVFFTDTGNLTPGSNAAPGEPDLYRYEVESEALTDLTVDSNLGQHADVQGLLGVGGEGAAAGSYVYFVANGVLAPGASPGDCVPISSGGTSGTSCNLYLSHAGATTFIASLSSQDNVHPEINSEAVDLELHDWAELPIRTAEVSPSGRYLAFGAAEELTPQPGLGAFAGPQAYRYDAITESLLCASCNPDGSASPAAFLFRPQFAGGLRQHYIANDGRLFFNDLGALSPRDVNGHIDVYEFEDAGTGTCLTPGGCRLLISGGGGTGDSLLAAVSAEGNDVFFTSTQQLTSEDRDGSLDMYDARVDGRTPPVPPSPCETAEACHEKAAPPPTEQTAGSATFHGPGNPIEKTCKKGFVKKGTKCVKKPSKHHGKEHHQKKSHKAQSHKKLQKRSANDNRRAGK